MERNRRETHSAFFGNMLNSRYRLPDFIEEFAKPCSRFKTPYSAVDLAELRLARAASRLRLMRNLAVVPQHTTPPNWQALLNYLYRENILVAPDFQPRPMPNDMPMYRMVHLMGVLDPALSDGRAQEKHLMGTGFSTDIEESYSKAVGELLERLLLTRYKNKNFVRSSYAALSQGGVQTLDIHDLNTSLPWQREQYPWFRMDESADLYWEKGEDLLSGKPAYIPAQLVYWAYRFDSEPMLFQPTTNGAAGHFTAEEATLAALYELVERDSFMIFWLNSLTPPVIDIDSFEHGEMLRQLLGEAERYGIEIIFVDTTTDLRIPTCICVAYDRRGEEPRLAIGGGSGFDLQDALTSGFFEAVSTLAYTPTIEPFRLPQDYRPFHHQPLIDKNERLLVWTGEKMLKNFSFFTSGPKRPLPETRFGQYLRAFTDSQEELAHMLNIFRGRGKGYEVYRYSVRHPVLRKLGFHVVKTVVPQLVPLYLTEHMATLDARRLHEVPAMLGYAETKLNIWPHPFP